MHAQNEGLRGTEAPLGRQRGSPVHSIGQQRDTGQEEERREWQRRKGGGGCPHRTSLQSRKKEVNVRRNDTSGIFQLFYGGVCVLEYAMV